MKKLLIISVLAGGIVAGCSDVQRTPNRVYMPDMAYSRAYETYSERDSASFSTDATTQGDKIFYNNRPVPGTVARGEEMPFPFAKDKAGDTVNYVAAKGYANPLPVPDAKGLKEAERLYMVNCGICHGAALDGNGPLYKGGAGPYPAAPKNLVTLNMPDGQMFYSITYGKNLMGAYASQLSRKQRWEIVHYIKSKQAEAKGGSDDSAKTTDSTATAKK
jgi:mono/diheme cytochrome c family protein